MVCAIKFIACIVTGDSRVRKQGGPQPTLGGSRGMLPRKFLIAQGVI